MKIFLDIDGVVADWSGEALRLMGLDTTNPNLEKVETLETLVDIEKLSTLIDKLGDNWWYNIPVYRWGHKLYYVCKSIAPTCFLSAPWNTKNIMQSSAAGKVRWIHDNFMTNDFLLGDPKHFCASPDAILIDDRSDNCDKFIKAGGHAYHWPNPFKITREHSWNYEIHKLINWLHSLSISNTNINLLKSKMIPFIRSS